MKANLSMKSRYLITFALSLAAILIIVTAVDIYQSRKEIYNAKTTEAVSLIEAVQKAGENVFLSNEEMENLIADKLLTASVLMTADFAGDVVLLNTLTEKTGIDHILIFSSNKKLVYGNNNSGKPQLRFGGITELDTLISGGMEYFTYDALEDTSGSRHFALFRRLGNMHFMLLLIDADHLLEFRRKTGIGSLFRNIARLQEISYMIIQDQDGITVASEGVGEMNSIGSDPFLTKALSEETISYREYNYKGKNSLEVVKPFIIEGETFGLIRIGISLDSLDHMLRRSVIRSIIISVFLLLTGVLVFFFISNSQRYSILQDDYNRIQTYTGNILANMSDGVITADSRGRINLMNNAAEKIFSMQEESVIGKGCDALIKSPASLINKTIQENRDIEYYEQLITLHNDKQLVIGGASSIIRDKDGKINTVIAVMRDLTSLRYNEELQKRREKLTAMGELAGSVAHEIKNPLNSIGINIQRFEKEFVPSKDRDEYLELINSVKSEIKRVTAIINQFLSFARPQKISKDNHNVRDFITDICKGFEPQAAASGIRLSCRSENINWLFDYQQMKQVLINLISNAFDAVNSGGSISLESFSADRYLIMQISDNGVGISKENLSKIFNLYFTTKTNGTGFGLSIVNQIVQEHGGKVKVESEINKGTKFIIEIP